MGENYTNNSTPKKKQKNPGTEENWKMAQILAATHKNTTTPEELYS